MYCRTRNYKTNLNALPKQQRRIEKTKDIFKKSVNENYERIYSKLIVALDPAEQGGDKTVIVNEIGEVDGL